MTRTYCRLTIIAGDPKTEIWVGDAGGHFVQKEVGVMETSLLPGQYTVQFGLQAEKRLFELNSDLEIRET